MSRVGKMPVTVPQGVDVSITAEQISVKGGNGTLVRASNPLVAVKKDGATLTFEPANDSADADAMSGTMRALVNNMINGVTKGFEKKLTLVGVGFRQSVGQVAAEVRAIRPPEPYKGKGIRYADERVSLKETKKK